MKAFEQIRANFQNQLAELIAAKEEIRAEYSARMQQIDTEISKLKSQRDELRKQATEDIKKIGDMVAAVELILEAGASPSPAENPSSATQVTWKETAIHVEPHAEAEPTTPTKPEKATKSAEPVKQTKLAEPKKPAKTVEVEKPVEPPAGSTPIIWAIDVEPGRYVIKSGRVYDREDGYRQPLASYADKYGEQCVGLEKFDGKGHKTISYRLMHKWLNRPLEYASKADAARRAWRRWCQENGADNGTKAATKPAEPEKKKQEKPRTETKPEKIDYTERRPIVFPEFPELPAGKYTITAAGSVRNEYSGETLTFSGDGSTLKVSLNNSAATKFDPHMGGGSVSKQVSVAKLVWNTYSGKPPIVGRKMFRYLDGNVHNCRIENIQPK